VDAIYKLRKVQPGRVGSASEMGGSSRWEFGLLLFVSRVLIANRIYRIEYIGLKGFNSPSQQELSPCTFFWVVKLISLVTKPRVLPGEVSQTFVGIVSLLDYSLNIINHLFVSDWSRH